MDIYIYVCVCVEGSMAGHLLSKCSQTIIKDTCKTVVPGSTRTFLSLTKTSTFSGFFCSALVPFFLAGDTRIKIRSPEIYGI